eukprot:1144903-Pelagomonas_calceolata.AAC.7
MEWVRCPQIMHANTQPPPLRCCALAIVKKPTLTSTTPTSISSSSIVSVDSMVPTYEWEWGGEDALASCVRVGGLHATNTKLAAA